MNTRFFILYSLLLIMGISHAYFSFKSYFSEEKYLAKELHSLRQNYEEEQLKNQLLSFQFLGFKQEVATIIPDAIKEDPYSYQRRNLASVLGSASSIKLEGDLDLFKKAKQKFNEKKYEEASVVFARIVNNYPESIKAPESLFLLTESYYQMGEYPRAMDVIEIMMQQFPEHILTGFSLIRLGKIYEKNDLIDDAGLTYKLILDRFNNQDLLVQARKKLEGLSL